MLTGETIILRPPGDSDLGALAALRNNAELQSTLMAMPRPNSPERVRQWLHRRSDDSRTLFFIIAEKATDRVLGFVQLTDIEPVHGSCEFGICLHADARGKGAAWQALQLLEKYAAGTWNLRKIVSRMLSANAEAIAFHERSGFMRAGELKAHFYHNQHYHDVMLMEKFIDITPGTI